LSKHDTSKSNPILEIFDSNGWLVHITPAMHILAHIIHMAALLVFVFVCS